MTFILLVGVTDDPVLLYVTKNLVKAKIPLVFLDQNELGKNIFCNQHAWTYKGSTSWNILHKDVKAVYNRAANLNYSRATLKQISAHETLMFLLDNIYPNVINRPKHAMSNFSKLGQLLELPCSRLKTPPSRLQSHKIFNKGSIYKSASNQRSVVKHVSTNLKAGLEPVLYQTALTGINYRVHILGNHCIATKIQSKAIDYRYCEKKKLQKTNLPKTIQDDCIMISKYFNLILSGIDLIYFNYEWFILEVNPSPGFDFFSQQSNDSRLMNYLTNYFIQTL